MKGTCNYWLLGADRFQTYFTFECGKDFSFVTGGPVESGFSVCPFCGKKIGIQDESLAEKKTGNKSG